MASDTFEEIRDRLRRFATDRGWEHVHTPKNLAMALAGEVGELLAPLQWLTDDQARRVADDPEVAARLRDELADVAIYLIRLADVLDVDLAEAVDAKIERNAVRFPADAPEWGR